MTLQIYNTLTRQKEKFVPLHQGHVGMYVCGPTVYSNSHIGHAKSYVSFDVMVRYLRYSGYKVLYIQNITDVGHLTDDADEGEDKLVKQARIDRVHPMQIAELFTHSYFEDMDALNVLRPDISPRASGHIIEQIEIIRKLVENGFAYETGGSVYFDVAKFPSYGKLSGRTLDESLEGTRVETRSEKRHSADFALWKKAEGGHIMRWPSPWGEGFPGWHIECSAMSMKYLGQSFDIHGGGIDNQFPHHECERAQSEAATGKPFVKYWVHNNLVTVNGRKMSKSLGNFVTLKDAFRKFDPAVVRFLILQSHYRSTLDFSDDSLQGAKIGLEKLLHTIRTIRETIRKTDKDQHTGQAAHDFSAFKERFLEAMNDDFNTPQAVAVIFDLAREANQLLHAEIKPGTETLSALDALFSELGGIILGIVASDLSGAAPDENNEAQLIDILLQTRQKAKSEKAWWAADFIRTKLEALRIRLEDTKDGTVWRKIDS
ncbi:MAG: cysteine--tRNA ligase [Bacteroidota bacterium]